MVMGRGGTSLWRIRSGEIAAPTCFHSANEIASWRVGRETSGVDDSTLPWNDSETDIRAHNTSATVDLSGREHSVPLWAKCGVW